MIKTFVSNWMETKKIKTEGQIKITQAKVDAEVNKYQSQANMDLSAQDGMRYSWKDEFWSIIFGAILISCFLPWTQVHVKEGFMFLSVYTPDWFKWSLMGIIAATFGLRTWGGWKK